MASIKMKNAFFPDILILFQVEIILKTKLISRAFSSIFKLRNSKKRNGRNYFQQIRPRDKWLFWEFYLNFGGPGRNGHLFEAQWEEDTAPRPPNTQRSPEAQNNFFKNKKGLNVLLASLTAGGYCFRKIRRRNCRWGTTTSNRRSYRDNGDPLILITIFLYAQKKSSRGIY